MNSAIPASLENKVLLIYLKNPGPALQAGIAVESVRIEKYFGREFLVGRVPFQQQDWSSGLMVVVACDEIAQFLVFDSEKEYQDRVAQAPALWENADQQGKLN